MSANAPFAALMMMQEPVTANANDIHWMMIWIGVIAVCLAVLFLALTIVGIYTLVQVKKVVGVTERLHQQVTPILSKTHSLIEDFTPKLNAVTANVEQISYTVRAKVDELAVTVAELNLTVKDLNQKTRAQAARVDGMVSEALTTTHQVSQSVQAGIKAPIRQIEGLVAGVKAGLETLIARSPFAKRQPGPYDL